MLNTLNYSEAIDAFSSFLSCTPKWYIPINGGFYSFNSDNKCFLHNSGDDYNYLDMSGEERRSVIRLLVNDDYETTKTFDNVSYSGDFEDGENLIPFKFKTRLHTTNQVDDVYNREDTYKFSIPRDSSGNTSETTTTKINYGRMYNWYAASDSRNIAPNGWHVPTDEEWSILTDYIGGTDVAGGKLKETGIAHWAAPNTGATNEFGFNAVPGGYRDVMGYFIGMTESASWWTSTPNGADMAWHRDASAYGESIYRGSLNYANDAGRSIRCVRDSGNSETSVFDIDGNIYTSVTIGTQTWLQQDLATLRYRNGDYIGTTFNGMGIGAVCNYNNKEDNAVAMVVIPAYTELFAPRLRGKYMVCDYVFKSSDGNRFRLPYIETTYRYSMI